MAPLEGFLYGASVWLLPALTAITLHEAAHGFAAWQLGDDTAKRLGRVSMNPLRHVDPFGTFLLPAMLLLFRAPFLFGYAKPVPVNFGRLNHPRRDMVLVALAGPGMNVALALIAAVLFHLVPILPDWLGPWLEDNLSNAIILNAVLAVFNMLPLPPLDGGRVAVGLLPRSLALPLARLEPMGMLILIGVIFVLPFVLQEMGFRFNPMAELLDTPVRLLVQLIAALAGIG
jgi:Zn-dependent protease